jgi:hypothetical protein
MAGSWAGSVESIHERFRRLLGHVVPAIDSAASQGNQPYLFSGFLCGHRSGGAGQKYAHLVDTIF